MQNTKTNLLSKLIEKTQELLAGVVPENFVQSFLSLGSDEDIAHYNEKQLAFLVRQAWSHLELRKKGTTDIRLLDPDLRYGGARGEDVTILEILNDDKPFLLDSTLSELAEQKIDPLLVLHPIIKVERNKEGLLEKFLGDGSMQSPDGSNKESLIHIHIPRIDDREKREFLLSELEKTFKDVGVAVLDWRAMRDMFASVIEDFKNPSIAKNILDAADAVEFLQWLGDDNFTFLGMREYRFSEGKDYDSDEAEGLGILREKDVKVLRRGNELVTMTPEIKKFLSEKTALIVTKANVKSRVHRRVHMDYIGIKRFDEKGVVVGELRLVGLFTSTAYNRSTRSIPSLRHKVEQVLKMAGFDKESHSGKALINVLEGYPRDELFQVDVDTLYRYALDILQLYERPRLRVLPRIDQFDRFVSIIVYVPRDKYDSQMRQSIGAYLADIYKGRLSASYPSYPEGSLARVHYIVGRYEGKTPDIERVVLEAAINEIIRTWSEKLREALMHDGDAFKARKLAGKYSEAFPISYKDSFGAEDAIEDIKIIQKLSEQKQVSIKLYKRAGDEAHKANLKVYSFAKPMPLSERVPVLENLGFKVVNERTHRIDLAQENAKIWLHDMTLSRIGEQDFDIDEVKEKLEAALYAVLTGECENDGFNALVMSAHVGWREVVVLRAMGRYLRQIRIPFSLDYLWQTLNKHSVFSAKLLKYFHARFDPNTGLGLEKRKVLVSSLKAEMEQMLSQVQSLDEDKILRRFLNVAESVVRTNFYQLDQKGKLKNTYTFKIASRSVLAIPEPKPLFEIFVYSTRVEGVHLRFGKVARGGLRWSDRPQDFRTEVLGLVKAQQVKNAVIVPVGSKGGFVPLQLPHALGREAVQGEGVEAYKIFVSSLLDLTDNLSGADVVAPENTVIWDQNDPYLVVAADKGTATFSDTANGLSQAHGFWLDDAFASGGSAGYDHKKMGITAKGGWEAVKRHFREMNLDIQTQDFSVAGVGDMSGDVFGNGMLLSEHIHLLAAFDHRDIFLDPSPDAKLSFAERKRMFELPRSSWAEYNSKLISKGGGVFSRSLKSIPLSDEVRAILKVDAKEMTPSELMTAILKMPVDLMWFGGIGTYIKSSHETDLDAGDRANDAHRINGADLRCKVIGEGANLGLTQKGRIEAALNGVHLNTDAIDNSAGVNSSDLEVNIKIAFSKVEEEKKITREQRNTYLANMTSEVGALVLRNNYLQTLALSLAYKNSKNDTGYYVALMHLLEEKGLLSRAVEYLPDDETLILRQKEGYGLTRPELAVLLAYAKLQLFDDLLSSQVPDDPYLGKELARYFPKAMQKDYPDAIETHRLRREIIATQLSNFVINRAGPAILVRLGESVKNNTALSAYAFAAARDSFGLLDIIVQLDGLDAKISGALQLEAYQSVQKVLIERMIWFVKHTNFTKGLEPIISEHKKLNELFSKKLGQVLPPQMLETYNQRLIASIAKGLDKSLAEQLAFLDYVRFVPDALCIKSDKGDDAFSLGVLLRVYQALNLESLFMALEDIATYDHYDRLAKERGIEHIENSARSIAALLIKKIDKYEDVEMWFKQNGKCHAFIKTISDFEKSGWSISKLTVLAGLLDDILNAGD